MNQRRAALILTFDKGIFIEFGNVEGETNTRKLLLEDGSLLDISIVTNDVVKIKSGFKSDKEADEWVCSKEKEKD